MSDVQYLVDDDIDGAQLVDSDLSESVETAARWEDDSGFSIAMPDGIDQEELLEWLYKDLHRGEMAQAILAEASMRRVAEFNSRFEHRLTEGYQLLAHVPVEVFNYWVAREGLEFWTGPEARKNLEFLAHRAGGGLGNPGFLVKSEKARTTVVVDQKISRETEGKGAVCHGERPPGAKAAPGVSSRRGRGRWAN